MRPPFQLSNSKEATVRLAESVENLSKEKRDCEKALKKANGRAKKLEKAQSKGSLSLLPIHKAEVDDIIITVFNRE